MERYNILQRHALSRWRFDGSETVSSGHGVDGEKTPSSRPAPSPAYSTKGMGDVAELLDARGAVTKPEENLP